MGVPKSYKIRFIEPGIISYNDSGAGVVFVSREALDRMAPSFRNCPVIFVPESHDDSDASTAFNFDDVAATPASGIVAGIPYWGDDGWMWADISVWDEEAQAAIAGGFNVSCAYKPTEETDGGEWHSIPYDVELGNGKYEHLAIVKRPRYEGSRILANSKGGHSVAINIFRKKENAAPVAPPIPKKPEAAPGAPEMVKDGGSHIGTAGAPLQTPAGEGGGAWWQPHGSRLDQRQDQRVWCVALRLQEQAGLGVPPCRHPSGTSRCVPVLRPKLVPGWS